jgi:hypothetical protein
MALLYNSHLSPQVRQKLEEEGVDPDDFSIVVTQEFISFACHRTLLVLAVLRRFRQSSCLKIDVNVIYFLGPGQLQNTGGLKLKCEN